ncbi:MAG TPA: winged helix-turn-helix domain-containing protein [Burkholderiaceae bacterium]
MYSTTASDTAKSHVAPAKAQSALVPLFTVTSATLPMTELATTIESRDSQAFALAPGSIFRIGGAASGARQLTTADCVSFINALLTQYPDALTVTTNGSQATIAATPAVYESLQGLWFNTRNVDNDKTADSAGAPFNTPVTPSSAHELVACLNSIFQRQTQAETSDNLFKIGAIVIDDDRHVVTVHGEPIELRPVDYKLLRFLVSHPERVFSRTQLLDKVWGGQAIIEERTVDTHVMSLRKSLGKCSHYVKTVHSVGYVLKYGQVF